MLDINELVCSIIGRCSLCHKANIQIGESGLCMPCKLDLKEKEEESNDFCSVCRKQTDEEELAEFDGVCYSCYDKAVYSEFEEHKHPDQDKHRGLPL